MSHSKIPTKTKFARAKSRANRPAKPGNIPSGSTRSGDQAGGRPRPAETAQGDNDRRHYEGDGLAAALGPRLLCRCGAQEARLDTAIGEGRGRTRLSCACRPAVEIEAEDLHIAGRLAMASMDSRAIEGLRSDAESSDSSEAANMSSAPDNKRHLIRAAKSHPAGAAQKLVGDGERRP